MTERIIDLSAEPVRLNVSLDRLSIEREAKEPLTIPFDEVGVLVAAHRQVALTQAVLSRLMTHGGVYVACDEKSMPIGMMMPLTGHHLQAERFQQQAEVSLPTKKRLWQQLIEAKVKAQAGLLRDLYRDDAGLLALSEKVRSGDPDNIEGLASRRYWPVLFGDPSFHRDRDAGDQNRLLNYGYAVLRATIARAICASGLHPSLGLHHHNRYDAFCLADDVMEPFRPLVDRVVVGIVSGQGPEAPLDRENKSALIGAIMGRYEIEGETRSLFDVAAKTTASLAKVFAGESKDLALPDI